MKKVSRWYHPVSCSSCRGARDPFSATVVLPSCTWSISRTCGLLSSFLPPGPPLRLARLFTNGLAHFVSPSFLRTTRAILSEPTRSLQVLLALLFPLAVEQKHTLLVDAGWIANK